MTSQPLSGLKVLDFSTLLPGPLAGLFLAEAGADVIKIEKPGGEDMRFYPPLHNGRSIAYELLNRGKTIQEIDLKTDEGRTAALTLVREADILVEQFRPGVMKRLGLDYDSLKAINPRLIYCSITGFGQNGPRRDEAGHDLTYLARTGLLALARGNSDSPIVPPALVADIAGGSLPAFSNILLALLQRARTGEGTYLDIALAEGCFTFQVFAQAIVAATGAAPENAEWLLTGGSPRYQIYPTSDGGLIAVGALEEKFWTRFCDIIGLGTDLRSDGADAQLVKQTIREIIGSQTTAYWTECLNEVDCCAVPVTPLHAAMEDDHFRQRGLFEHSLTLPDGQVIPALSVQIDPAFRRR
ncbi:CaiB/BaiF CoA transferase family protein [Coralliovum pocilloporae]|uniref:CaiB/BaiF CoA transferase family protein n=1 Tax=Coralliovum pocilloporae TaxID=3066369 RepID=UPI0033075CED